MRDRVAGTGEVERTVEVSVDPAAAYRWWTEPELLVRWMGSTAEVEPRAGGIYRIAYGNGAVMRGEVVDAVPGERLVLTWGWEDPAEAVGPGGSLVEVAFEATGAGTRIRVRHSGLPDGDEVSGHAEGWDYFLGRLVGLPAWRGRGRAG